MNMMESALAPPNTNGWTDNVFSIYNTRMPNGLPISTLSALAIPNPTASIPG
jgi:hypothetical protein